MADIKPRKIILPASLGHCVLTITPSTSTIVGAARIETDWKDKCQQGCGEINCCCDTGDDSGIVCAERGGNQYNHDEEAERQFLNASIDGVESFLVSLAGNGVDVTDEAVVNSIRDAHDAIGNSFG